MSACVAVSVAEYKTYAHPRSGYVRPQTANQINSGFVHKMQGVGLEEIQELERCANIECPECKYKSFALKMHLVYQLLRSYAVQPMTDSVRIGVLM